MKREYQGRLISAALLLLSMVTLSAEGTWMRRVSPQGNMAAVIGGSIAYDSVTNTTVSYYNNFTTDVQFLNATHAIRGSWGNETTMADQYDTYVMTWVNSVANVYPAHPEYALPENTVGVGRMTPANTAYWYDGFVCWHVRAPIGMKFTGGTVTLKAHAEGMWNLGALAKYRFQLFNAVPDLQTYLIAVPGSATVNLQQTFSQYGDGGAAYYDEDLIINIPNGLSEFYLMFDCDGGNTNNTAYMKSLTINGEVAIAEMPIVTWSGDTKLLKYKWQHELENTIGMSGFVVKGINMGLTPSETAISQDAKDAMTAGRTLGIDYYAYLLSLGYTYPSFPATTFRPPTAAPGDPNEPNDIEWKHFMDVMTAAAQQCGQNSVAVMIIDVEKYTEELGYGDYMFSKGTDPCELYWAYQRGAQVGQIFQQYAPSTAIMLIPELDTPTYWGGSNGAWNSWQSIARFRNGLMSAANPRLKVWVGLEGTYGLNGETNDVAIGLRVSNSNAFFVNPVTYKTALAAYLSGVSADCRAASDDPTVWDNYGGIAPAFSVLGVASSPEGQQSSWYSPAMFAAQLEGFAAHPTTRMIWTWCWRFPFAQFSYGEVAAAGLKPFDGNLSNPDYWTSYYAQIAKHPYLEAYLAVMKARGTPAQGWQSRLAYDIDGDAYVDMADLAILAANWLTVSATNGGI